MSELKYLTRAQIVSAWIETSPLHPGHVTGYGRKIPLQYKVKLTDNKTRRVYCANYGNGGSVYVIIGNEWYFLDVDSQYLLQEIRDSVDNYKIQNITNDSFCVYDTQSAKIIHEAESRIACQDWLNRHCGVVAS